MWETAEKDKYNTAYDTGYFPKNILVGFPQFCKALTALVTTKIKLLDIGCGPGISLKIAQKHGIEAFGIDIAENCKQYWNGSRTLSIASANNLPFTSGTFDVVSAWDVLEHIPEQAIDQTLKEIKRVSKLEGLQSVVICLTEEQCKHGDLQCHLTVHNYDWWIAKINQAGFRPLSLKLDKSKTHLLALTTRIRR